MVQHVTRCRPAAWPALLAIFVAGGGLLWHLLACTDSPMAFSPSGKDLAFVTMEPFDMGDRGDDSMLIGPRAYRLMVLTEGKQLRVVEETVKEMLTAPAYSPDGTRYAYFRVPLLAPEGLTRVKEALGEEKAAKPREATQAWAKEVGLQSATFPTGLLSAEDRALPPLAGSAQVTGSLASVPSALAVVIERDARTDSVLSTFPVELPTGGSLAMTYIMLRPQYGPDGRTIYAFSGNIVLAVNPSAGSRRIIAACAGMASLSPDGKLLAVAAESSVGFVRTDGESALYHRWDKPLTLGGMVWADRGTLALLELKEDSTDAWVHLLRTDGTLRKSTALRLPDRPRAKADAMGELAISPNGRSVAVSFGTHVFFMDADGRIRGQWKAPGDKQGLVQPTFSPDSKRVAMKYMVEEKNVTRAAEIVFFSPEGKELSRAAIPPIPPGTTRPATQPAGPRG